jgi:hypothetical protein
MAILTPLETAIASERFLKFTTNMDAFQAYLIHSQLILNFMHE